MGFYPELDNLSLEQLIERFHGPPLDGSDYATAFYQEVASLIRQQGEAGVDFLLRARAHADTAQLRGILLGLTFPPVQDPRIRTIVFSYLHDERPLIVADAVDGLQRLGATEAVDEVLRLRHHASPYVRASVLRFLSRLRPELAWPMLLAALRDQDKIVRETAIDELDAWATRAIEAIEAVLEVEDDPDVRQAAEAVLARTA